MLQTKQTPPFVFSRAIFWMVTHFRFRRRTDMVGSSKMANRWQYNSIEGALGNEHDAINSLIYLIMYTSRAVGIATGWTARVRFPAVQHFSLLYSVQADSGAC
jgi:hypothetical protein